MFKSFIEKTLENQINQILPYSQDWIMNSIKAMGFKIYDNGACKGVSQVGIRDYLSGNILDFNKLFELVHNIHYTSGAEIVREFIQDNPEKIAAEGMLLLDEDSSQMLVKAIQENVAFKIKNLSSEKNKAIIKLFKDISRQYASDSYNLNDEGYDRCGIIRAG